MPSVDLKLRQLFQGQGPYAAKLKKIEADIKEVQKRINEKLGQLGAYVNAQSWGLSFL